MPDFELTLTTADVPDDVGKGAITALATRYPEVDVVGRYRSDATDHELWICRAPSVAHVERWVGESALRVIRIRRLAEP